MSEPTEEEFNPFPDFQAVEDYIADATGEMMDVNAEMIRYSRASIQAVRRWLDQFTDLANGICEAHAVGAAMASDLTTNIIMEEYAVRPAEETDTEDE